MIGPDDIGERRQTSHTPSIALGLAAVLLLVVGALSYRDFVRSSLEKEYAEKEARLMQLHGVAPPPAGGVPAPAQPAGPIQTSAPQAAGQAQAAAAPAPGTVLYDAQGNPVYLGGNVPYPQTAGQQAEAGLPAPEDPEIGAMRQSLAQARELGRLTEQRYNQLAAAPDPSAREAAAIDEAGVGYTGPESGAGTGAAQISAELPDFLRIAVENPPGGNPEIEATLERMRAQVVAAPSLAKVIDYDTEWGVVTFDAGAKQGVRPDQRFAVRRGGDVIGWIRVEEVEEDQAVGTLTTRNRDSDTAVKPGVGDDLIDFELF